MGELPEWLTEQFAKLSTRNRRVGSNPTLSAEEIIIAKLIKKLSIFAIQKRSNFQKITLQLGV
jgi:hypothetical protein